MSTLITPLNINLDKDQCISGEVYLPEQSKAVFVLAHGAGAGMNHIFMKELASDLSKNHIATLRYNFLYMEQKKKRPDFPAVAHKAVKAAIDKAIELFPDQKIFAGGKSFGGRMTSQWLSNQPTSVVSGVVFVGFPLHPAGNPSINRADHLKQLQIPMLFLQGTRDTLAEWPLIESVCSNIPSANLVRIEGADHAFKLPKQKSTEILASHINGWIDRVNQ